MHKKYKAMELKRKLFLATYLIATVLMVLFFDNKTISLSLNISLKLMLLGFVSVILKSKKTKLYLWIGTLVYYFSELIYTFYNYEWASIVLYLIATILFTSNIYSKKGINKSFFNIITFAFPFAFFYAVIFFMISIKNNTFTPLFLGFLIITSLILCVSSSLILNNFSQKPNTSNRLYLISSMPLQLINFFMITIPFMPNSFNNYFPLIFTSIYAFSQLLIAFGFIYEERN